MARALHAQLKGAFPVLAPLEEWDLLGVADAVANLSGGEDALRQTSAKSANFKSATPGYAHRVLAHLMLEGAIDVLTTNWDNCIERGSGEEHLPTVTNESDLADVTPPWVLKVHGCASRPGSLLVTTAHLKNPPKWVQEQTHARLGSAVVVFIGIGDVAPYVKQRIIEAITEVGSVENIRVVSPDIKTGWDASQWKVVAPELRDEDKISVTADEFMGELGAAYIVTRLAEHCLNAGPELAAKLEDAIAGLSNSDSLSVLQWSRKVDINPRVGESVLKSSEFGKALIALGHLVGNSAALKQNQVLDTSHGPVEILIATQTVPTRRLVEAAENRLHGHASRGEPCPLFLIAGGVGPIPMPKSLPPSIIDEVDDASILDGPLALVPNIRHADEVIAS
ncbi:MULTISPECIES: SIR2 family protein [Rhodococcus]|uniref:SIR2 family protein n=1 Tax=Rhodococcus artemisiae TaxID=714159 RepID=A0ABU7LL48_9NOCA|nr:MULTISPECIES: SIR2 family protein [Rhodococcus]MDV6297239.1 SIR2 family protein [Rhodococcus aetherivorans]MEE2062296.1 SIR2 family protein [Rhodococcus artemisiae]